MAPAEAQANEALARRWVEAFNGHDLDALLSLYAPDAEHTSPKIRALHPATGGKLKGQGALRAWWADALQRLPALRYELTAVTASAERVFIEYQRHVPGEPALPVAEVFDVRGGKIVSSRVYHG